MFRKFKERHIHFLILAFLLGLFLGMNFSFKASASESVHKYLDYFHNVYQIIDSEYVEVPKTKDVFYGAITGMIKSLGDPYSRFLDEKSYSELKEITTGKFVGVGIEITLRDGDVVVITPIDNSPAMDAGIMTGDIISKVNGEIIKNRKLSEIVKLIKGLPGTNVKLSIKREGYDEYIEFDLKRAPVKIKSVEYKIIKNKQIGYIKMKNFGSDTTNDTAKAIKNFNDQKIDKLILDLRYNPGGLLGAAIDISDLFLKKGEVIVSTKRRKSLGKEKIFKSENESLYKGKLVLLVNKGSASASEILSGAIRDNKRGKLLGEKTFGKGSVQKSFNLNEKLGVAITIARYYTPSGEMIHKKGIMPDYKVLMTQLSNEDKESLKIIEKKKLLGKYMKEGTEYNENYKNEFHIFLKNNNIKLSELTANFILKNRIYRYKKKPLYDLEFDEQLNSAIKIITKQ